MKGWRSLLGLNLDHESAEVRKEAYLFCPDCAEREFGPVRGVLDEPSA